MGSFLTQLEDSSTNAQTYKKSNPLKSKGLVSSFKVHDPKNKDGDNDVKMRQSENAST